MSMIYFIGTDGSVLHCQGKNSLREKSPPNIRAYFYSQVIWFPVRSRLTSTPLGGTGARRLRAELAKPTTWLSHKNTRQTVSCSYGLYVYLYGLSVWPLVAGTQSAQPGTNDVSHRFFFQREFPGSFENSFIAANAKNFSLKSQHSFRSGTRIQVFKNLFTATEDRETVYWSKKNNTNYSETAHCHKASHKTSALNTTIKIHNNTASRSHISVSFKSNKSLLLRYKNISKKIGPRIQLVSSYNSVFVSAFQTHHQSVRQSVCVRGGWRWVFRWGGESGRGGG